MLHFLPSCLLILLSYQFCFEFDILEKKGYLFRLQIASSSVALFGPHQFQLYSITIVFWQDYVKACLATMSWQFKVFLRQKRIVRGGPSNSEKGTLLYHLHANTLQLVLARVSLIMPYNHRLLPTLTSSFLLYLI